MTLPRLTLILLVATTALSACSHRNKDVRLKKLHQTSWNNPRITAPCPRPRRVAAT